MNSRSVLVPLPGLIKIFLDILALKLPHPLDFIEVNHKALLIRVVLLDALSAEYSLMVGAKEVHHSVGMQRAELLFHALLVILVEIEVALGQLLVFLHHLVQNVDVER